MATPAVELTQFPSHVVVLHPEPSIVSDAAPRDVLVIAPDGHLHVGNRQQLKQFVVDEIADHGRRWFVLDFSSTAYVDNSGIGALVAILRRVNEAGGALVLVGMHDDMRIQFELTKMDTIFTILDSVDQALAFLAVVDPAAGR